MLVKWPLLKIMPKDFEKNLIEKIKEGNISKKFGRLTIFLAREFGFCYGVERAVQYAYDTCKRFPGKRVFLTNEIIHNPRVNFELQNMGVEILADENAASKITEDDIVIMPAFGVTAESLKRFREKKCVIVDTTCGSVMSVWKRIEMFNREKFTAVIHGKYDHEETRATCSRAEKYLVVRNKEQAQLVCDYILGNATRDVFDKVFNAACSAGFNPSEDLGKIGFANQTTMLSRESIEISELFKKTLCAKFGSGEVEARFRKFDTICSATQDRQDAIRELGEKKPNVILVIGGYRSSNTGHLVELASEFCRAFHVEDSSSLISNEKIRHKKTGSQEILETLNWLPKDEVSVGITAGASTPNKVVEEVIQRLVEVAK